VTDYDVWHVSEEPVTVEMVIRTLAKNTEVAQKTLARLADLIDDETTSGCDCGNALENAIITNPAAIKPETKEKLNLLVGQYLG
jgi:5'-methylthioadenosine phosphorylase